MTSLGAAQAGFCFSGEVVVAGGHEVGKVDHSVGVAPLVVVPRDDLNEAWGESDTSLSIKDRGTGVGGEVLGDDGVLSVAEDALELVLGGFLDALLDLVVGGIAGELDGEVNDRDVSGGHAEGHASELAVEGGDNLANGLGGTSGRGNDVATSGAASTPVLATLGWAIDGELVDGHGMDGGHETLLNTPGVVENLGDGGEAVGGAGGVGDDSHAGVVLLVVDTHDEDRGIVLGRSRDDSLLGSTLEVSTNGLLVSEDTSALSDVVSTDLAPRDLGGISLLEDIDHLAVNFDSAVNLFNLTLELT